MVKSLPANEGDAGLFPGLGRCPGEENGNALGILAWEIPWTEEQDGQWSMGWQKSDMA